MGSSDWLIYLDQSILNRVLAFILLLLDLTRRLHDVISEMVSGSSQHIFPVGNAELGD